MGEPTRFVIVGMQRSGTTVTHDYLQGHPEVGTPAEEVHAAFFAAGDASGSRFLDVFDHVAGRQSEHRAVGLKTALPSAAHAVRIADRLRQLPAVRVVLVERADLVAQLGSLRRAQSVGTWHRDRQTHSDRSAMRIRIGADEFAHYVADVEQSLAPLRALDGGRLLRLGYERDIASSQFGAELSAFLGITPRGAEVVRLAKIAPAAADYIEDHAALRRLQDELLGAPCGTPTVAPAAAESRQFLVHQAQMLLARGDAGSAARSALAAFGAPPDWGVETSAWAAAVLGDALFALGDLAAARTVAETLRCEHAADDDAARLAQRIQAEIERTSRADPGPGAVPPGRS